MGDQIHNVCAPPGTDHTVSHKRPWTLSQTPVLHIQRFVSCWCPADCPSRLTLPSEGNEEPVTEPELIDLLDTELKALSMVGGFDVACEACPVLCAECRWKRGKIYRGPHQWPVPVALRKQFVYLAYTTHQGAICAKQRLVVVAVHGHFVCIQKSICACVTFQINEKKAKMHAAPQTAHDRKWELTLSNQLSQQTGTVSVLWLWLAIAPSGQRLPVIPPSQPQQSPPACPQYPPGLITLHNSLYSERVCETTESIPAHIPCSAT